MPQGYLSLVLHAHLPFVRHPEHENFLEEDWLFQAITETYIPLIQVFHGLVQDGVPFKITMSLTPTLLSMLSDDLLQQRYVRFLDLSLELAKKEIIRTRNQPEIQPLAQMYFDKLSESRELFVDRYQHNLVQAFKDLMEAGHLEIITCGATHGYLPLMNGIPNAVRAQIQVAVQTHEQFLGVKPSGIWLPECAYQPGIETYLAEAGLDYFFLDTHGLLFAQPRPRYGVHTPVFCSNGVAAFGRDAESSKQVWSSEEGYPGDFDYREFYRDIGYDLDHDYIRPYIAATGERKMTGFKYHRITGATDHKETYRPQHARSKTATHAGHFLFNRQRQINLLAESMDRPPLVVAPYDAELFGHWWYEGPDWLNFLIRKVALDQEVVALTTPADYLKQFPKNPCATPAASSWGYNGYHEHWLTDKNDWVYRHLHKAAGRMVELAQQYTEASGLEERALNQAARELLLAQASDWAFIMYTGTMVEYALKRTKDHLLRFTRLYEDIRKGKIDEIWLADIESKDNIFPAIDFRVYL
jgi:1,4-alpha-glucan branching enzyme